ncbi:hypothetical protein RM844_02545 [Streptomyces sp. DSM 44915]|uniref:DUF6745 domain-containing protein n=1 Tax=Streptomyces chisholmiae TaxID=3075540 RepID=A0ABU2JLN5_9ACTN|nr:hypothetical protein [Streptomyces sp. DSM 44915]MDT0265163.1 hypothetical protein [Streptomyces sp. DSM 44915]
MNERVDWRSVAVATGAAERATAEAAVRAAYRRAGLPEPEQVLWVASPLAAVRLLTGAPAADGTAGRPAPVAGRSVRAELRDRPIAARRGLVHQELGPTGWGAHWRATGADLWETSTPLVEQVKTAVLAEAEGWATRTELRLLLLDAVLGPHEAAWLSALGDEPGTGLDELAAVARAAGWWWPYERVAVLSERPTELHRDEAGRLDRSDGPALAYGDGFALYAWRGMAVSGEFFTELAALTPQRIRREANAELRRVMLEHYGYERYLSESGAEPVHRDETGVLWRIPLSDDEDVVMVEVVNSTPEPDGTFNTYWLRVPPATRTAREGVAWTFGLDAEAYAPLRQT